MAENALIQAVENKKQPPLVQFFELYRKSIGDLLEGTNISPERFRGLIVESAMEQRQLLECLTTARGRQSLISSMRKVASLGFEPGAHLGQCWILPSRVQDRETKQWIVEAHVEIGYQGYKDLMYESGLVAYIKSDVIYDTDTVQTYSFGTGDNDQLRVDRDLRVEVGEPIAYMVKIMMTTGHEYIKVLSKKQVNEGHMQFTRSRNRQTGEVVGPWRDHYDAMAQKSCIIEARKDMPRKIGITIQRGLDAEFKSEVDIPMLDAADIEVEAEVIDESHDNPKGEKANSSRGAAPKPNSRN
jgi:recombination protein RecT